MSAAHHRWATCGARWAHWPLSISARNSVSFRGDIARKGGGCSFSTFLSSRVGSCSRNNDLPFLSNNCKIERADADCGCGGAGYGMMWCDKCVGEGMLVTLTKKQKRARKWRRLELEQRHQGRGRGVCETGGGEDGNEANRKAFKVLSSAPILSPKNFRMCLHCDGTGLVLSPHGDLPTPMAYSSRVEIIGAGIGGAALALTLQQRGVSVALFEKDHRFTSRKHGYGLTMQKYSGGTALSHLGLVLEGVGSSSNISFSSNGDELGRYGHATLADFDESEGVGTTASDKGCNVHLPRQVLRQALLRRLAPGTTQWRQWLECIEGVRRMYLQYLSLESESSNSDFAPPVVSVWSRESCDLLVGADGIFSKVREILVGKEITDEYSLHYSGVLVVLGICHGFDHPLCHHKVLQVVDGESRLYVMPFSASPDGDGVLAPAVQKKEGTNTVDQNAAMMWQFSFPLDEASARDLTSSKFSGGILLNEVIKRCEGWPDPVHGLLVSTKTENVSGYPVFDRNCVRPADCRDLREKITRRVVLIGDAAHPMSPFKGQGANQALLDAVQLARALVRTSAYSPHEIERLHGCVSHFSYNAEVVSSDICIHTKFHTCVAFF